MPLRVSIGLLPVNIISYNKLTQQLPAPTDVINLIATFRNSIKEILQGNDSRLMVIVGPCSIHDEKAALEFADNLAIVKQKYRNELFIIMRTYFEKPRTTIGWKGFLCDPLLDGSYQVNFGLQKTRELLIKIAEKNIPTATEFLDPNLAFHYAELISWGCIGARTSSSQLHRELASALPMPIGFKNTVDGNISIAMDAVKAAYHSHHFLKISEEGFLKSIQTKGNPNCHVVLRGGINEGNFFANIISHTSSQLEKKGLCSSVIVDCSHGNSQKDYLQQMLIASYLANQMHEKDLPIAGIMLESNLIAGKQSLVDPTALRYGQSITDACLSWEQTEVVLEELALLSLRARIFHE